MKHLPFIWYAGLQELQRRFKKSMLGGLWLFLGPALLMSVYWFVFDKIVGIRFTNPDTGVTAPFLAVFSVGFMMYLAFNELIGQSATWFNGKRRLITETDLPLWGVFGVLVVKAFAQYVFYLLVSILICVAYGLSGPADIAAYLAAACLIFVMFTGVGFVTAFLGLFFGDVKEVMPVLMRIMFYGSSITFPLTLIPDGLRWIPLVNPLTWAVELARSALLWDGADAVRFLGGVSAIALVAWALAALLYWRLENVVDQVA